MSTSKQLLVVVYDISIDRRRSKRHDKLAEYGNAVQHSVFECLLSAKRRRQMQRDIDRIINPRQDHVRIYTLCQSCVKRIQTTAGEEVTQEVQAIIV